MFLGLPDPDPSDRGVDPVNPSINKQKKLEKPGYLIRTVFIDFFFIFENFKK